MSKALQLPSSRGGNASAAPPGAGAAARRRAAVSPAGAAIDARAGVTGMPAACIDREDAQVSWEVSSSRRRLAPAALQRWPDCCPTPFRHSTIDQSRPQEACHSARSARSARPGCCTSDFGAACATARCTAITLWRWARVTPAGERRRGAVPLFTLCLPWRLLLQFSSGVATLVDRLSSGQASPAKVGLGGHSVRCRACCPAPGQPLPLHLDHASTLQGVCWCQLMSCPRPQYAAIGVGCLLPPASHQCGTVASLLKCFGWSAGFPVHVLQLCSM